MSISQKEAVYNAVVSAVNDAGVSVESSYAQAVTKEIRANVVNILAQGFKSKEISLDKTFTEVAELRAYCSSLISNWLRKDKRLNGGESHAPKNPGSRLGNSDPQIKALRSLLKVQEDEDKKEEILQFIDHRLKELNLNNPKQSQIDYDALPAELRAKFSPAIFDEDGSEEENTDEDE